MNAYKVIDRDTWPRKELFDFYQTFDNPAVNISVAIDAGHLFMESRRREESFFLMALYAILHSANEVPQMRQRIVDGKIVEFEKIAVMTPIMTKEELFRQIWCEDKATFEEFRDEAAPKVDAAKNSSPLPMIGHGEDFLCASCVPWLHFTSITQADYKFSQSTPILAWGKMNKDNLIPISCRFNHAFMDGLHISRFFNRIEERFSVRLPL